MPTVAVATDLFAGIACNEAELRGLVALPIAVVEHPVAGSTRASIRERAELVADEVAAALTSGEAQLRALYAGRVAGGARPAVTPSAGSPVEGGACEVCLLE